MYTEATFNRYSRALQIRLTATAKSRDADARLLAKSRCGRPPSDAATCICFLCAVYQYLNLSCQINRALETYFAVATWYPNRWYGRPQGSIGLARTRTYSSHRSGPFSIFVPKILIGIDVTTAEFRQPRRIFRRCLKFFREYQYLFNYPNTDFLIHNHNILDKITIKNEGIDVFNKDLDLTAIDDEFLSAFFMKLKKLQVFYDDIQEDLLEKYINAPIGPKKKHEILHLAKEIKDVCEHVGCQTVVDFGSGLGYLDQLLFETTNYRILGIECNESHYVGAKIRQRKYHSSSTDNVKYIKHTVTENSHDNIQEYLHDKFENHTEFCIAGLHACADLTIDAIKLFLKMDNAKTLVLLPCCYHKMVGDGGVFKNFPLSDCLKGLFGRFKGDEYMRVPFLRLAAQPPSVDNKLEDLVFNLLSRAVLQAFAFRHNCKLKRKKRKAVKTKNMDNNFEVYIEDATTNGFTLIKNDSSKHNDNFETSTFHIEELKTLWKQLTQFTFTKAGIFILLQNYLQPVIENFVLFDRQVYLKEKGVKHCEFKRILNVKKSPRCLALLAYK